jgi:predicted deacetylase
MVRKFSLSLDDMSPHENAGLDFESIKWCDKIIEAYPTVKINLFVPAAYCRLGEQPCYLSANREWVEKLKALSTNYRINFHGLHHRRTDKKHPASNNDEFQFLDAAQADLIIQAMVHEFEVTGINYTMTFRPPGWKISKEACKKLAEWGFDYLAGAKEWESVKGDTKIKWVNYNWDLLTAPPDGDVIAYGHTSNWTTNYMNEERYNTIMNFLKDKEFDFRFIEEM